MASLKDLRNRIASVKATQKITKAMQMVATARLRRAQQTAVAARPYAERMGKVLANLAASIGEGSPAPALLGGHDRISVASDDQYRAAHVVDAPDGYEAVAQ